MRSRRRSSTPCLDSPRPALSPFLLGPVYTHFSRLPYSHHKHPSVPRVHPSLTLSPYHSRPNPTYPHSHTPTPHTSSFEFAWTTQTQTAQNVVDRIQKFKRFEAAAAPPGQLKLKSSSTVDKKYLAAAQHAGPRGHLPREA